MKLLSKIVKIFSGHKLSRFGIVRQLINAVVFLLSPITISGGSKLFLHPSGLDYVIKAYEPFKTEIIIKNLKNGDVFLDIGAGVGYYTVIASKIVGISGKVFCFEPTLEYYQLIQKNITINRCQNVTCYRAAATNKAGKTRLYLYDQSGSNRIEEVHTVPARSIEIETVRIDDMGLSKADFIKIDVEGSEYLVLQGMEKLLINSKTMKILMELPEIKTVESLRFLEQRGFDLYEVLEDGKSLEKIVDVKQFENYIETKYIFAIKE